MTDVDFGLLLELLSTLSDEQKSIALTTLQGTEEKALPKLYQRLEQNFCTHLHCGHCQSENVRRHGYQHQRQRYLCKNCGRTFNALTGTPFANVKLTCVLDQYLECMTTSMTLRPTARQCGISLDTAFHLRHRVMQLLQEDQAELLQGIVELDEAFFRLSHKGSRNLDQPPRKRGGIRQRPGKPGERKRPGFKVKQVPVVVTCDRESHLVSNVLSNMQWRGIEDCLKGRIPPGTPLCADALSQHDRVADELGLVLKSLVTRLGQTVREGVFHLQHVNGHHSELKSWINEHFKGVATKYLYRYLGWRRALSNCELTLPRLIEKLANHWVYQLRH